MHGIDKCSRAGFAFDSRSATSWKDVERKTFMTREDVTLSAPPDPAGEVRAFYETHPYPAPLKSLDRHRELYRNPDRRRALTLLLWPTRKPRTYRKILVAGCGT